MTNYKVLIAKTDPDDTGVWLPLWMHLKDTAGVMRKLVHRWVTPSMIQASGLSFDNFEKVAVFVAYVHDIGKATAYFQDIISAQNGERRDRLYIEGYKPGCIISGKTPHTYAGQWILQSDFAGIRVKRSIADLVGAHHGRPIEGDSKKHDLIKVYEKNFFGDEKNDVEVHRWKSVWSKIVEDACYGVGIVSVDELSDLSLTAQVLLTGLLITADWIASNTQYFPLISIYDEGDVHLYPSRINEGYSKAAFHKGWRSETFLMDSDIFRERFGFYPNSIQQAVIETVNGCSNPGIFVLEAEPGVGKTEAALTVAEVLASKTEAGGVFFGLPTQATSNGLFGRLYDWAASVSEDTTAAICLAHGAAELNADYEKLIEKGRALVAGSDDEQTFQGDSISVHPWFQGNKKTLLADFVIGTVDQFLMASLRRRHFMLRHLGLAGKVVIIDECHAYDAYMNEYLERSLEWMAAYKVPVILLSATLPSERRQKLVDAYVKEYCRYNLGEKYAGQDLTADGAYPLLTWSDGGKVCQRKIEQKTPGRAVRLTKAFSMEDVVEKLDELLDGGCACVIMNTVKAAQQAYKILKKNVKSARVMLYHAQFTMPDRTEKEQELLKAMGKFSTERDRRRFILVGTQVLEQSLDYDADIMVTQLCPVDLLMQRLGRLHRHERIRPVKLMTPECVILYEKDEFFDEGTKAVYGEYLLCKTLKAMGDRSEILIPDEIPVLVGQVYRDTDDDICDEVLSKLRETYINSLKEKSVKAEKYLLKKPLKNKSIEGILINQDETAEKYAECSVRDGESSVEVLLMKMRADGRIGFAGDGNGKGEGFSPDTVPEGGMGRIIARQRIRLPHVFSLRWNIERTIRELEEDNRNRLPSWQKSPWIKGELVLLLDAQGKADLCGYRLTYTKEMGLIYAKEDADAGEGIQPVGRTLDTGSYQ